MKFKFMVSVVLITLHTIQPAQAVYSQDYWPTEKWLSGAPEDFGMDSPILAGIYDYIESNDLEMHSVVIIKDGYIIEESYPHLSYDQDTTHIIYSCTKSITSALIGIAIREGYLTGIDQRVLDFFPDREITNIDAKKQALTIEHLLTMTSGLEWNEWPGWVAYSDPANTYRSWVVSDDWVQFVLDRSMVKEPGEEFNYNTAVSHLLSAIIQQATGITTLEFAQQHLFEPLGINKLNWPTGPQGVYEGGSSLALTPRDMAKFGYLYLNKGIWDGEQILPRDWVEVSTKGQVSAESHISGCEYGYQWWIYPNMDMYAGLGYAGQQIFVLPDYNIVIVFTGNNPSFVRHYIQLISDFIIPAEIMEVNELAEPLPVLIIFIISGTLTMIIYRKKTHKI